MKINGNIELQEGGRVVNLTLPSGNDFPDNPNNAELFCLDIDLPGYPKGHYRHDGTRWILQQDYNPWPSVKKRVPKDEEAIIPQDHEMIVHDRFTVEGTLKLEGELYIL